MSTKRAIRITQSEQTLDEEVARSVLEDATLLHERIPVIGADKSKGTGAKPAHVHRTEIDVTLRRSRETVILARPEINTRVCGVRLRYRRKCCKRKQCSNERDDLTHSDVPPYFLLSIF
jgi:hypothetical protein